ncbi:MAG: c-type cytochrome [Planctomycetaceae bacterium]|nr:c-type cytochrome [Planctomycetaceae bacterium]
MSDNHHDDHHGFAHVMSPAILLAVFGGLIVLTIVTVLLAGQEALKGFDIIVALSIATVKAALVVLFFMHMIHDKPLNAIFFMFSFVFVALFLVFALSDTGQYQKSIQNYVSVNEVAKDEDSLMSSAPPGERMFVSVCASCHQVDQDKNAPSLQEIYKLHQGKPEQIVAWAMDPKYKRKDKYPRPMPSMAYLGKYQLNKIAEFMLKVGSGEVQLVIDDSKWIRKLDKQTVIETAMAEPGNAQAGQSLFTTQTCISCHISKDGARPVGPLLTKVSERLKKEDLIESILDPSAKIAKGYETVSIITVDGKVETGMIIKKDEAAGTIELRRVDGTFVTLNEEEDIDDMYEQKQSQMPAGVVDNITPNQLADLIAYLQSL